MLGAGHEIGTTPELLGHSDVSTTMHCTHALNRDDRGFGDRWAGGAPVIGYCGGSCRTGDGGRTIPCRLIDSYAELIGSAQVKVLSRVRDLSGKRQRPMDDGATWKVRRAQGSAPQPSSSSNVSGASSERRGRHNDGWCRWPAIDGGRCAAALLNRPLHNQTLI